MRDMKFKGKDPNGEWRYGSLLCWPDGEMAICFNAEDDTAAELTKVPVDPATVGQFTGLHDKNDKEIYEGDILTIHEENRNPNANYKEWKSTVVWSDNDIYSAGFRLVLDIDKQAYGNRPLCQKTKDDSAFVIIGNIHDNPELLKN